MFSFHSPTSTWQWIDFDQMSNPYQHHDGLQEHSGTPRPGDNTQSHPHHAGNLGTATPQAFQPQGDYFYATESLSSRHNLDPSHLYPPSFTPASERHRPPMSIVIPQTHSYDPHQQMYMPQQTPALSPYVTPGGVVSGSSTSQTSMLDYFPNQPLISPPDPGQTFSTAGWSSQVPPLNPSSTQAGPSRPSQPGGNAPKTSRQQFTACGACRHRRVKCDLKDRQEEAERKAAEEERSVGPIRGSGQRRKKVSCTNCMERNTNCIDEYAPLKAQKQLRRGKRISEIEMLYGKSAAVAAVASSDDSETPSIREHQRESDFVPELTKEFFDSPFFRRFQVQRPVLDPSDFVQRYLSASPPNAAAMGPEGALLCHVLVAWAASYGVDERGRLDVPDGGGPSLAGVSLSGVSDAERQREADRQRRWSKMRSVVEVVLREIDDSGVLRRPTWDGVRALLLILPLTEGISTPVERLAMYQSAVSQVHMLCSFAAMGYDGQPSGTSGVNGGSDDQQGRNLLLVRVRIYWYTFVHEGITTGLKGGILHLDDEDLETIQDSITNRSLVQKSSQFRTSAKFATAPIQLAMACRLINKALTGQSARRRAIVNGSLLKDAWEALERCWEDFEGLRNESPGPYTSADEVVRFSDGWKIFMFEAQNIIRTTLEKRLEGLSSQPKAYISDVENTHSEHDNVRRLLDIANSKCEVQTRLIMDIVRRHVGTSFFEWDASLVRDGTYYAAMLLAKSNGGEEDIVTCVRALNELRWAHAKSLERSADLRREWHQAQSSSTISVERFMPNWDPLSAGPTSAHSMPFDTSTSNSPHFSDSRLTGMQEYDYTHAQLAQKPPPNAWFTGPAGVGQTYAYPATASSSSGPHSHDLSAGSSPYLHQQPQMHIQHAQHARGLMHLSEGQMGHTVSTVPGSMTGVGGYQQPEPYTYAQTDSYYSYQHQQEE